MVPIKKLNMFSRFVLCHVLSVHTERENMLIMLLGTTRTRRISVMSRAHDAEHVTLFQWEFVMSMSVIFWRTDYSKSHYQVDKVIIKWLKSHDKVTDQAVVANVTKYVLIPPIVCASPLIITIEVRDADIDFFSGVIFMILTVIFCSTGPPCIANSRVSIAKRQARLNLSSFSSFQRFILSPIFSSYLAAHVCN